MSADRPEAVDAYPLSPTQAGMLHHAVTEPGRGIDIEQVVIDLHEHIDVRHFREAWRQVVLRHTILRTRFRWEDIPEARQEVVEAFDLPFVSVDWCDLDSGEAQDRFDSHLAADRGRDFDLTLAPLMRIFVARLGEERFKVVWTFHHAVLDGRSFPRVLREVFDSHEVLQRGGVPSVIQGSVYREYIERSQSLDLAGAESYWRRVLSGFSAATPLAMGLVARDSPEGHADANIFGACQKRLPRALTLALRDKARDCGATLGTLLLAAWSVLLSRYSGETDVVFGSTWSMRDPTLEGEREAVGLFINTVPIRVDVDPERELDKWLRAFRLQLTEMRSYAHAPLFRVQSWSSVRRGTPLFESLVVFDHQSLDNRLGGLGGSWARRRFEYTGQTNYPLAVIAYGDEEMLVRVEYSRNRFGDAAMERMLGHLTTLLSGMALGQASLIKDLRLLTSGERAALLSIGRDGISYPPGLALQTQVERQVERSPDAIALTAFSAEGTRIELSYSELNRRANRVAHRLRALGLSANQLVGLRTERNAELVVGLLGILKAGAAYLPLDPVYPIERVAFMLEDSGVTVVLTQSTLREGLSGVTTLCLDEPLPSNGDGDPNPPVCSGADDLAYVIYTSGSTGKPKGARITHQNVSRLFSATDAWFGFNESDVWSLFHSYAFDFSVWELWGALLRGGRVVVVPLHASRSTDDFVDLLVRERVTVLNQTPTAFGLLTASLAARPPVDFGLRYVIFGGEALEFQQLRGWFERYGDTSPRLVNMYGITETTVHVSYRPLSLADTKVGAGSTIGVPLPDLRIYILDPQGEPVPTGVAGEMYVAGGGVGQGYLNRPELSAERFLDDPFDSVNAMRMYRTGDLARRLEDGDIEYLGRIDQQVKIRGFRIELGEIEAVIARHPHVRQVAVVVREDAPGDKRLVAYLVADGAEFEWVDDLRQAMRSVIPDYMVPAHFLFLPVLPLTQNGKLDRRALPEPPSTRADHGRTFVAPRSPTEQAIASVWQAVLRVDRVGIEDHFFELGGDSILSIQVIARCRQKGLHFTARDLFNRPTIAQLAPVVRVAESVSSAHAMPSSGEVPLTPIQHWFFEQRFAEPHHWNQAFIFEVPADLDTRWLGVALRALQTRHAALRLRYHRDAEGLWRQAYETDAESTLALSRIDLSGVPFAEQRSAIESHASAEQLRLNFESGPVLRAIHFGLGPEVRGRLMVAIHHLVVDGVSWRILREDLESLYLAASAGEPPTLAGPTSSFQVWSNALLKHAQSEAVQAALPHWRAIVARPSMALPHHAAGQPRFSAAGSLSVRLSADETSRLLQRVPVAFGTQINDALLTALALSIQRWAGGVRVSIDIEGHGREHIEDRVDVSRTVGWFTTLIPIALDVDPNAEDVVNLQSIQAQLRSIPDRGLSYGLLRYLSPDASVRDALSSVPAAPVLFNYLGQFDAVVAGSTLFSFARESTGPWRSPRARPSHPLEIIAVVRDGQMEIAWHHDAEPQFEPALAQAAHEMVGVLRRLVAAAERPHRRQHPSSVGLPGGLGAAEFAQLSARYPRVEDVYPLTPMQRLFLAMEASSADLGFEQWHFLLEGDLDTALLHRAVEQVIQRHTILRTAVVSGIGTEPLQVVCASAVIPWSEEDWRGLPEAEQSACLAALLTADARGGFDLELAPMMRVALRRVADDKWHFVWSTHHLCIDGWSWPVVLSDVSRAYVALGADMEATVDKAVPFGRYVAWLADSAPDSEAFWKARLAGLSAPTPFRLSRECGNALDHGTSEVVGEMTVALPEATTRALQSLARSARVTLSAVFNGAWALLLSHYSGTTDVVVGAAFSGRPAEIEGIETMVGPCVNNLPLRFSVDPAMALLPWLTAIQEAQFETSLHQYASLEQIQEWSGLPWRHRLFDSLIVFQNYSVDAAARGMGTEVRSVLVSAPEATNYALTLAVSVATQLRVRLLFKHATMPRADVAQFADDLATVLTAMAVTNNAAVHDILSLLPVNSRGRAADVAVLHKSPRRATHMVPASDAERKIAAVWRELFAVDAISLDDNFFDLGGHSLLLVRAHAQLKEVLRADLSIVALLQFPTVRMLARHLSADAASNSATAAADASDRARRQREAQARQRALSRRR